jgi:hypothetical protein
VENERDNRFKKSAAVYSKTIRAGKRRTYFFDVRTTKSNDYYITLTESKKKFNDDGYDRHKIFLYKEDFNKFVEALNEAVNHVKQDLLPEYDFDEFSNNYDDDDDDYDRGEDEFNEERKSFAKKTVEPAEAPAPPVEAKIVAEVKPEEPINDDDLKWD